MIQTTFRLEMVIFSDVAKQMIMGKLTESSERIN